MRKSALSHLFQRVKVSSTRVSVQFQGENLLYRWKNTAVRGALILRSTLTRRQKALGNSNTIRRMIAIHMSLHCLCLLRRICLHWRSDDTEEDYWFRSVVVFFYGAKGKRIYFCRCCWLATKPFSDYDMIETQVMVTPKRKSVDVNRMHLEYKWELPINHGTFFSTLPVHNSVAELFCQGSLPKWICNSEQWCHRWMNPPQIYSI